MKARSGSMTKAFLETEMLGVQRHLAELAAENRLLWKELASTKDEAKTARTATPASLPALEGRARFFRDLRKNALAGNATSPIPKQAFVQAIRPWLEQQRLEEDDWKVERPTSGLSRRWSLVSTGRPAHAADKVDDAFRSLRNGDGVWREFWYNNSVKDSWA